MMANRKAIITELNLRSKNRQQTTSAKAETSARPTSEPDLEAIETQQIMGDLIELLNSNRKPGWIDRGTEKFKRLFGGGGD